MALAPRESQGDAGAGSKVSIHNLGSHPHSPIVAGLELNEVSCLSLPAWETKAELPHRDVSTLKVSKTSNKMYICGFFFTPLASTGRLQLDRESNYTSIPLDSSFP